MFWYGFMLGVVAFIFTIILTQIMYYLLDKQEGETFSDAMIKVIAPYNPNLKGLVEGDLKEERKDANK